MGKHSPKPYQGKHRAEDKPVVKSATEIDPETGKVVGVAWSEKPKR